MKTKGILIISVIFLTAIYTFSQTPTTAKGWFDLAKKQSDARQTELAIQSYTNCIRISPKSDGCWGNRGIEYKKLRKHTEALADLNKAIELDPISSSSFTHRGETYMFLRQAEKAKKDFDSAIIWDKRNWRAYNSRGDLYRALGQNNLAIADYTKAIEISPTLSFVYRDRGKLYRITEKYSLAEADLKKYISNNPNKSDGYQELGLLYAIQGKNDVAFANYSKAISLNPNSLIAVGGRGDFYRQMKKRDLAIKDFEQAIKIYKSFDMNKRLVWKNYHDQMLQGLARVLDEKAVEAIKVRNYQKAIDYWSKAVNYNPDSEPINRKLAATYYTLKNYKMALIYANRAIKLSPKLWNNYFIRAKTHCDSGNISSAKMDEKTVVELGGKIAPCKKKANNYRVNSTRIVSDGFHRQGLRLAKTNPAKAIENFNAALVADPTNTRVYFSRADAYLNLKKDDLAKSDFTKFIESEELKPSGLRKLLSSAYVSRAFISERNNQTKSAIKDLSEAIRKDPKNFVAYFFRGKYHKKIGDVEKAKADFQAALKIKPDLKPAKDELANL